MGRKKPEDLTGRTFGLLKVIGKGDPMIMKNGVERTQWRCQCECENIIDVEGGVLVREQRTDCGCVEDAQFIGKTQHYLTPLRRVTKSEPEFNKRNSKYWCQCVCGRVVPVDVKHLRGKTTKSCGCMFSQLIGNLHRTHGKSQCRTYTIWIDMIRRCHDSKVKSYEKYGAKGIRVCDRWRNSFEAFLEDMGECPSDGHSVDRFPNGSGDYEPGNVRWATWIEQARNRSTTRMIEFRGETRPLPEWAEVLGMDYEAVRARFKRGWDAERAFTEPIKPGKPRKRSA